MLRPCPMLDVKIIISQEVQVSDLLLDRDRGPEK